MKSKKRSRVAGYRKCSAILGQGGVEMGFSISPIVFLEPAVGQSRYSNNIVSMVWSLKRWSSSQRFIEQDVYTEVSQNRSMICNERKQARK